MSLRYPAPLFVRRLYSPLRGASRRFVETPVPFGFMELSQATTFIGCTSVRSGQRIGIRAHKKTPSSTSKREEGVKFHCGKSANTRGRILWGGDYSRRFLPSMETSSSAARVGATLPSSTSCRTLGSSFLISSCW